jgi:hypothetical protein
MEHVENAVKSLLIVFEQLVEGYSDHWSSMERLFAAQLFAKSVEARFWHDQGVVFMPEGVPGETPLDDIEDEPIILEPDGEDADAEEDDTEDDDE